MLLGTTFAWFTDSVTSANNIIQSGNLDVELYHTNSYVTDEKVAGLTDLFTVEEGKTFLWEPGAVVWENFTVANEGTLALKYQLALNFTNATKTADGKTLADVLKVAVINGGFNGTREDAKALSYNYSLQSFAMEGKLEAGAASDVYGIVIYWAPSANDNDYNVTGGLSINLGVNLFATQLTSENDSFDNNYDADAWGETATQRPEVDSAAANVNDDGSASMEVNAAPSATTNKTTVDAPAGTFEATDKVAVEVETNNSLFNVNADGDGVVAELDITMTVNGEETSADLEAGKYYTITTYISKGLSNVNVTYTGNDGKDQPTDVTYDPETGKLTFKTNHFSNYAVSGEALAYDAENDTALTTIEQVVEATKNEVTTIVIPEANKDAIEDAIKELPAEKQEAAVAATAVAKIGDVTYATFADAFAAANAGDTIVVLNNISVNQMFVNTKAITLNLNGKTITCIDTTESNFSFIDNKGILTVTGDGTITVTATVNSGWNRYSAVIANNPGGKLIIENGTIEHLGGTDMAYGIDNLTNGKGTYAETIINGGLIKSPYRAVRQFLNGAGAENILTVTGGTLEGANKAIFFHDPSKNANTGKLTVSENAVLKGDVYLFVTAGSTEWPVEVSIADRAVKGEIVTGNVPDGYIVVLDKGAWTIVDHAAVVGTADELLAALNNSDVKYIQFKYDINMAATESNGYGKTGINVKNGQTIDGNGFTLKVTGAGGTWGSAISTTGGLIKNLTVAQGFRGIFVNHNSTYSETVVLDNVTIQGPTYTISCDQGMKQNLVATNCTINGWTSYAATIGTVTFTNCNFGSGAGYKFMRPYAPTVIENCTFVEGYSIDARDIVNFVGESTFNGVTVTRANVATLVTGNASNVRFDGAIIVSDASSFTAALAGDENVTFANDISFTGVNQLPDRNNYVEVYGNKTGFAQYGGVIDGKGYKVIDAEGDKSYVIVTHGGTIKNLTITTGARGIVTYAPTDDVYIDNVVVDGAGYALNSTEHAAVDMYVTNSTINGWTSLAGFTKVVFEDCKLGENTAKYWQSMGYDQDYDRLFRVYSNTFFTDCEFEQGYYLDMTAGGTATLTNCTVNGVVITAENYEDYITIEIPEGKTLADCVVFA